MKIHHLNLKNFGCYRTLDLDLPEKIAVFVGRNGSGKSTILDAVRTLLRGTSRGVAAGDRKALATWGESSFTVEADVEFGPEVRGVLRRTPTTLSAMKDGKPVARRQEQIDEVLGDPKAVDALLDVWKALDMTPAERKALVYQLAGIEVTDDRLRELGLTDDQVRSYALAGNWARAEREAAQAKREANRAAAEHEAPARTGIPDPELPEPPADPEVSEGTRASEVTDEEFETAKAALAKLRKREKDLDWKLEAAAKQSEEVLVVSEEEAEEIRKNAADLAELVKAVESGVKDAEKRHAAARKNADAAENNLKLAHESTKEHACSACGLMHKAPERKDHEAPDLDALAKAFEAATLKVVEISEEIEQGGELLERHAADLKAAREDVARLPKEGVEPVDVPKLTAELEQVRERIARGEVIVDLVSRYQSAAEQYERSVEAVKASHEAALARAEEGEKKRKARFADLRAEAADYERQEHLCRPDGIQSQLLAPALGPIRERLRWWDEQAALGTPGIFLSDDFEVRVRRGRIADEDFGQPVSMLSSSERWRVALALADALAQLSGLRFLALDETTLLDGENRDALISTLLDLEGDYDQMMVCAVTGDRSPRQAPEGMPIRIYVVGEGAVGPVPREEGLVGGAA